jgi:hypothetical protein
MGRYFIIGHGLFPSHSFQLILSYIRRNTTSAASTTPWSIVLLETLIVTQLVKKFSAFYGTRKFITVFTRARHWSLSSVRQIQSTPYFFKSHFNIMPIYASQVVPRKPSKYIS